MKTFPLSSLAQGRVTLGPHDAARAALDESVVELLQRLLAIGSGVVVDIGISQRATESPHQRQTRMEATEPIWEKSSKSMASVTEGVELANVERGRGLGVRDSRAGGGTSSVWVLRLCVGDIGVDGRCAVRFASHSGKHR